MALLTVAAAGALQEQEPPPVDLESLATMTDGELIAAGFDTGYSTDDVPYAMLVDSLFDLITGMGDEFDVWWHNRGLDPDSDAVRELEALAMEVESRYPSSPEVDPSVRADDEAQDAWRRAHRSNRYQALGAAFGRWLENRRSEGYPPEIYLDRLLGSIGRANFSTESQESLERWALEVAGSFEAGVSSEMSQVPRLLTVAAWEEE